MRYVTQGLQQSFDSASIATSSASYLSDRRSPDMESNESIETDMAIYGQDSIVSRVELMSASLLTFAGKQAE